jgi:hypothetical protein
MYNIITNFMIFKLNINTYIDFIRCKFVRVNESKLASLPRQWNPDEALRGAVLGLA